MCVWREREVVFRIAFMHSPLVIHQTGPFQGPADMLHSYTTIGQNVTCFLLNPGTVQTTVAAVIVLHNSSLSRPFLYFLSISQFSWSQIS